MSMDQSVVSSLKLLSGLLTDLHQPWWLIGPAAVGVLGGEPGKFTRLEVVMSPGDGRRISEAHDMPLVPGPATPLKRARKSLTLPLGGLNAVLMVQVEQHVGGRWVAVNPKSRVATDLGDGRQVFTPNPAELAAILRLSGRASDIARAESLERLG